MFSTLKHHESGSGFGHYVLEATTAPFEKQQQSHRISRLACVYCRGKKVKCTGEEHGCQRCLEKQITCSYVSPSRKQRHRHVNILHGRPEKPGTASAASGTFFARDDIMVDPELLDTDLNLTPQPASGNDEFSVDKLFDDMFPPSTTTPTGPESAAPSPSPLRHAAGSDDMSGTTIAPSPTSQIPPTGQEDCLCSEMLSVFETVEVCLSWGQQQQRSRTDRVMTVQKEVLKSCDKWLSWDAPRIQSQHAVLMISILDRLLASLLSVAEVSTCGDGSEAPGGDEESVHVLKSLLDFRASRLKGLLERLWAIAAANQWRVQTSMVQRVLERLAKRRELI